MKDRAHCTLVEYDSARLDELVRMWRASFEAGVGIVDPHPIAAAGSLRLYRTAQAQDQ